MRQYFNLRDFRPVTNTVLGLCLEYDSFNVMLLTFARYTEHFVIVYICISWNIPESTSSYCQPPTCCGNLKSTLENLYFVKWTFISRFSIHNTGLRLIYQFVEVHVIQPGICMWCLQLCVQTTNFD